jgi:hypothetical protein
MEVLEQVDELLLALLTFVRQDDGKRLSTACTRAGRT